MFATAGDKGQWVYHLSSLCNYVETLLVETLLVISHACPPLPPPGVIRLWDASTGQNLHSLQPLTGLTITETPGGSSENPPEGGYTGLLLCSQLGALAGVTYDHNIIFYSLKEPEVLKQVWKANNRAWHHRTFLCACGREEGTVLKIAAGHWPFSVHFSIMATQKFDHDCIILYRGPIKILAWPAKPTSLIFSSRGRSPAVELPLPCPSDSWVDTPPPLSLHPLVLPSSLVIPMRYLTCGSLERGRGTWL